MRTTAHRSERCEVCGATPATWQDFEGEVTYCNECGTYAAGRQHGRALVALDMLRDALAEMRGVGLTAEKVAELVELELGSDGVRERRDLLPPAASEKDPRPWVTTLTPISTE